MDTCLGIERSNVGLYVGTSMYMYQIGSMVSVLLDDMNQMNKFTQ